MCSSFQIHWTRLKFAFQPPNTSGPVSTRCVRSLPCLGNVSTIFRHQRATRGRRLPPWDGAAACRGSGRAPDRPFFPRPFPAPRSAGRIPPSDGDARGTSVELRHASVWAGCLLEDQHVQGPVRHQLLQPRVLLLELRKLLGKRRVAQIDEGPHVPPSVGDGRSVGPLTLLAWARKQPGADLCRHVAGCVSLVEGGRSTKTLRVHHNLFSLSPAILTPSRPATITWRSTTYCGCPR